MKSLPLIAVLLCISVLQSFSQANDCASSTSISSATTCITTAGNLPVGATYTATGLTGPCTTSKDVWYNFIAQASSLTFTVGGALTNPRFQLFNGNDCSSLTNAGGCAATATISSLTVGKTYYLRIYSNTNASGNFTVCITHPEPGPTRMKEVFKETILANNAVGINSAWEITYEDQEDSLWMTENRTYRIRKMHPSNGGSRVILDLSDGGGFDANYRRTFTGTQDPWPQGGMMGFAIHPQFLAATNPKNFVYVAYVRAFVGPGPANGNRNRTATNPSTGEAVKGDLFTTFIVRLTYNTTTKLLENPVALCDTITGSNDHNSGRLTIAPIGGTDYLFYSCGDMGAGQFYSAERTYKTQMTNSYEGKILRFNLEEDGDAAQNVAPRNTNYNRWIPSGTGVHANPYNGIAPVTGQSAVWNIGHRNIQGLAFANGQLYGSSHGPFSDDEVNVLESGKNYGHPLVVGYKADGNYNNAKAATANFPGWGNEFSANPLITSLPTINESVAVTNYQDPIYSLFSPPNGPAGTSGTVLNIYNLGALGNDNSVWPSIAPSGMDAYNSTKIPGWKNSLVLASLKRGYLMRIKPNAGGTGVDLIDGSDTAAVINRQNRYRDLAFDPNGWSIYAAVDRSGSTSGPTATTPVSSACPGCIIKYTFLGYADNAGTSTISTAVPIDAGTVNNCVTGSSVTIDATNNNLWVPLTGPNGEVIAEIKANGNNLGNVTSSFYTRTGSPVRQAAGNNKYANRNITINVATQPTAGNPASVRLYINSAELASMIATAGSGVTSISDLGIYKNSDPCGNTLTSTATQQVVAGRYVHGTFGHAIQTNVQSFSSFYFLSTSSTLPVDFITISAAEKNNAANIQWTVTNQGNISSYIVERSIDNRNFDGIGTVTAVTGNGDINYSYTDYNAARFSSVVYYRIRAVEQTGQFKFTNVVNVAFGAEIKELITLFPNPAADKTLVSIASNNDETAQLRIIDNTGRMVYQRTINIVKGKNNFELNTSNLSTGLYYVEVNGKTINQKIKLIKQ